MLNSDMMDQILRKEDLPTASQSSGEIIKIMQQKRTAMNLDMLNEKFNNEILEKLVISKIKEVLERNGNRKITTSQIKMIGSKVISKFHT